MLQNKMAFMLFTGAFFGLNTVFGTQITCPNGQTMNCRFSDPNDGCACPDIRGTDTPPPPQSQVKTLDGTYDIELTMHNEGQPDHIFHDQMTIQGKNGLTLPIKTFQDDIVGTMTVPNAFIAQITGRMNMYFGMTGRLAYFKFQITADENGLKYDVFYEASIDNDTLINFIQNKGPAIMIGTASVKSNNGQKIKIGDFKAVRRE